MTRFNSKLSLLIVAQLILLLGIYLYQRQSGATLEVTPIVDFSTAEIDQLVIADDSEKLTLKLNDDKWVMPDTQALPADKNKLDELFNKISELKTSWPVATKPSSHSRFEVSEDKFQRHLAFYSKGELVANLYLGSSPGFRKVHLRRADDDEIYAVKLNVFELPTLPNDWLDKSLLSLSKIKQIKGNDFQLTKADEKWQLATPTEPLNIVEAAQVDQEKAIELSTKLNFLNIQKLLSETPKVEASTLEIASQDKVWKFSFYQDGEKYAVSRDDVPGVFAISQTDYEELTKVQYQNLILQPVTSEEVTADKKESSAESAESASDE